MYNEILKSFVDSGHIIRYEPDGQSGYVAAEEAPCNRWKIFVRRMPYGLNVENLRDDLEAALPNSTFEFYDEDIGVKIRKIQDGCVVFRHDKISGTFRAGHIADNGQFLSSSSLPDRDAILAEARTLAREWDLPLVDLMGAYPSITKSADLKGGDA